MSFTIRESIEVLEVDVNLLKSKCETFHDEFFFIKLSFRKHVLTAHPDRGGDPQRFREVNVTLRHTAMCYACYQTTYLPAAPAPPAFTRIRGIGFGGGGGDPRAHPRRGPPTAARLCPRHRPRLPDCRRSA